MAITREDICNKALVLIGASKITSFTDGTTEAETAGELYDEFAEELLSNYPWTFAHTQVDLGDPVSPPNSLPLTKWTRAWNLPAQTLVLRSVYYEDRPLNDYGRLENYIMADADAEAELTAEITYRPSESVWPAYFRTALEYQLASAFAGSVTGKAEFVAAFEEKFEKQFARARSADAQSKTSRRLPLRTITSFRR